MKIKESDADLFRSIAAIPSEQVRERMVDKFDKKTVDRLKLHLEKLIRQRKGYKISDPKDFADLKEALKPHAKIVDKLLEKSKLKKDPRAQKGGWIFSVLVAILAPIVVDLITKAVTGK